VNQSGEKGRNRKGPWSNQIKSKKNPPAKPRKKVEKAKKELIRDFQRAVKNQKKKNTPKRKSPVKEDASDSSGLAGPWA